MELHILRQDEDQPDGPEDSFDRTTNECVSHFSVYVGQDLYADALRPPQKQADYGRGDA